MEIIIHVGLPKAGSSFLQRNVFPYMNNINLLCPKHSKYGSNDHFALIGDLIPNKINIISNENFYGNVYNIEQYDNQYNIARRLHLLYSNAKVIVVFRNKKDWIESLTAQFMSNPFRSNLLKPFDLYFVEFLEIFDNQYLDFKTYEKFLKKLFKEVLVLQFEDLKKNPDRFVRNISDFIGVDFPKYNKSKVMVRFKNRHLWFIRQLTKLPLNSIHIEMLAELSRQTFRKMNR